MARPKSKNPRQNYIGIKCTDDDLELLIQAAHIMQRPLSTMVRAMAVSQAIQIIERRSSR